MMLDYNLSLILSNWNVFMDKAYLTLTSSIRIHKTLVQFLQILTK